MIDIKVLAMSDKDVYLAYEEGEGYLVFSLASPGFIELGDVLSHPHWDDRNGLFFNVKNLTKDAIVHICLENWSMNLETATGFLKRLNHPTQFFHL